MKRMILALLAALALPAVASAQQVMGWSLYRYDVTAASYTYCALVGQRGDPFGEPILGSAQIKTTGSSTTVVENVASTNPFANLGVGDVLYVRRGETTDRVSITAKASAAQVTVDTAVNWSTGYDFRWLDLKCGTADTDGWFGVGTFSTVTLATNWVTKNATSLDLSHECAMGNGLPFTIGTVSLTAAGRNQMTVTAGVFDRCRIGMKLTADTGAQVVNAYVAVKQ